MMGNELTGTNGWFLLCHIILKCPVNKMTMACFMAMLSTDALKEYLDSSNLGDVCICWKNTKFNLEKWLSYVLIII